MKKNAPLLLLLTGLSVLSGYLLSKASLVGRTGMNLFYKEYKFLKTWYKGAALVLGVLLLLFMLQGWTENKFNKRKANSIHAIAIVLALAGLFFTYQDFRNTLSHRLLGERFHIGAYLFWIGWIIISGFYLIQKPIVPASTVNQQVL